MTVNLNKNDTDRANAIIEYAWNESELERPKLILLIKDIIGGKQNSKAKYWKWKVLGYIEQTTRAIQLDYDQNVDTENDDTELPIVINDDSKPLKLTVKNKQYLIKLLEYIEDRENDTFGRISKYIISKNKKEWF